MKAIRTHNLHAGWRRSDGTIAEVVRGVSLAVEADQTVALVGESGCGKSTLALALAGLLEDAGGGVVSGSVVFESGGAPRPGRVVMIGQEPTAALNPVRRVGAQLVETVRFHARCGRRSARAEAFRLLGALGFETVDAVMRAWPHQLSGGMAQRVNLALALACDPRFLIADEPTSALDCLTQSTVLTLLSQARRERGLGMVLITHDWRVAARMADRIVVMYAGGIVESGPAEAVLQNPLHPYTRALRDCAPVFGTGADNRRELRSIPGNPPDHVVRGCPFHPRCERARATAVAEADAGMSCALDESGARLPFRCVQGKDGAGAPPRLIELATSHAVACWYPDGAEGETETGAEEETGGTLRVADHGSKSRRCG